jgi:predicted nucleotide-binding protein
MIKLKAKFEILYNDLIKLSIGTFLVSREFKRMLLKFEYHEIWQGVKKVAENDRNFISTGMNHEKYDSEKGLILILNHIDKDPEIKKFLYNLILSFIAFKKEKTNFEDLVDSIDLLGFDDQFRNEIDHQINLHELKYQMVKIEEEKVMKKDVVKNNKESKKRIFVVHGHKEGELNILARLLEKQGLNPIILNEEPSGGMTIIEKFEAKASTDFAIILLTGDDKGNQKDQNSLNLRARQNVIFEMGYFFALLGRKNVVCLQEEEIEVPSDLGGHMYIKLDKSNNWKLKLIQELKHAGFDVTADKI